MIVYSSTKAGFVQDVLDNAIADRILDAMRLTLGHGASPAERAAWMHSMDQMYKVLADRQIPDDAGVSIEYRIPLTSKRVDFIISGHDASGADMAVIVELKQWSDAAHTGKDGIVSTFVGGKVREMTHPSYQAWSYAALLQGFNEAVYDGQIELHPCAYLHNCASGDVLRDPVFEPYLAKAPAFLKHDAIPLRQFIHQRVRHGDSGRVVRRIETGRIKPSKTLADSVAALMKGKPEFVLIDDQKVVFEAAKSLVRKATLTGKKHILIVNGGPGTGKSVVAVNLLVSLLGEGKNCRYVSKNAAPRAVYASRLAGTLRPSEINNLFVGSGSFTETAPDTYNALIVDEAHRLNEKSGLYGNLGENQIKELIHAARCTIFFLDEDQKVTFGDIGDREAIRGWSSALGVADIHETELLSQFRCNGSDGYLSWVDHVLQVRETANDTLAGIDYDFQVLDSPTALQERIETRNAPANRARLVAGYCWDWASKRDPNAYDIVFPEHDFRARWNLSVDGSLWIIKPGSVREVGCIHTCQGLELDYVGVIVGPDLIVRDGIVITDGLRRSSGDRSIRGLRQMLRQSPDAAQAKADKIIKNTYRTLMTRGQKGCYIFSDDAETREHFRQAIAGP